MALTLPLATVIWEHIIRKFFKQLRIINPLKTEFVLNNIQKFSLYLTGNTLRLHYKAQPVNAVWGNSRCLLLRTILNTQIHCVGRLQSSIMLKQVVYIRVVTAMLWRVNIGCSFKNAAEDELMVAYCSFLHSGLLFVNFHVSSFKHALLVACSKLHWYSGLVKCWRVVLF
jgi:hypothetical protein